MKEMLEIDCVIVRRKMSKDERLRALEGRVIEEGQPRQEKLELSVPQLVKYILNGGSFYTGRETESGLEKGGELEVVEEDDQYRVRTVEGTEEQFQLANLPAYSE